MKMVGIAVSLVAAMASCSKAPQHQAPSPGDVAKTPAVGRFVFPVGAPKAGMPPSGGVMDKALGIAPTGGVINSGEIILGLGYPYNSLLDTSELQHHKQCIEAIGTLGPGGTDKTQERDEEDTRELVYFNMISQASDDTEQEHISAEVGGSWAVASFKATLGLQNSSDVSSYGTDIVGIVDLGGLRQENLDFPYLNGDSLALLTPGQAPDAFVRECGDTFVHTRVKGASLHALIHIAAKDANDKRKLDTEFSGSGWGLHANVKFGTEITNVMANHDIRVTYVIVGGAPVEVQIPGFTDGQVGAISNSNGTANDAIKAFVGTANNFIKGIKDSPDKAKVIAYELYDYKWAQNYPAGVAGTELVPEAQGLAAINDSIEKTQEQQKEIAGYLSHTDQYGTVSGKPLKDDASALGALKGAQTALGRNLSALNAQRSLCKTNPSPSSCSLPHLDPVAHDQVLCPVTVLQADGAYCGTTPNIPFYQIQPCWPGMVCAAIPSTYHCGSPGQPVPGFAGPPRVPGIWNMRPYAQVLLNCTVDKACEVPTGSYSKCL